MAIPREERLLRSASRQPGILSAFVIAAILGCAHAQAQRQTDTADSAPRTACTLSGQTPEQGPFDPSQAEMVSNPHPVVFGGRSVSFSIQAIARILGVRPLVLEFLDEDQDAPGRMSSPCERLRVYSVGARLGSVLQTLRFGDLVKATLSFAEGTITQLVLTDIVKIEGTPVYFHPQTQGGVCRNRTGTLVQYSKRSGETVVINNDGAIYFRDSDWRVFDRQRVDPQDLTHLMEAFHAAGFSAFTSQKWEVGDHSVQPYVALVCARFQKVLIPDHRAALAPVMELMEKVKAKALSETYYLLVYQERREITFLDWPFPQIPPDQVEANKRKSDEEEWQAMRDNRPVKGSVAVVHQKLPPEFFAKLPLLYGPKPGEDPNRDVYFKDGGRMYRVVREPNNRRHPGTVYDLRVTEIVSAETALASIPMPADGEPTSSRLTESPGGFQWPESMGVALAEIPPTGQSISNADYSRHKRLYSDLLYTENTMPGRGVNFVEGRFLYTNVRLTRLEGGTAK